MKKLFFLLTVFAIAGSGAGFKSLAAGTADTIQIYPSVNWTTVNSANLTVTDDFSYLTINTNPGYKTTGIRKNLGFDFGKYKFTYVTLNIIVDTISTFTSTGIYPYASPWTFELMSFSTFETFSTLLKQGENIIELNDKMSFISNWNGIQISNYILNNAYPKFIKIRSIVLVLNTLIN